MTKVDELVEWVALRLHTQERMIFKMVEETSPINCRWEELTEHFKKLYRQTARQNLSHKDAEGRPDLALIDRDILTNPHTTISEMLDAITPIAEALEKK